MPGPERLLGIGVDGARGGWLAVVCHGDALDAPESERRTEVSLCLTFSDVIELRAEGDAPVAVDIPMGLLDSVDFRPCDREARRLLEHRRDTVFAPPSRPLIAAPSYADARAIVEELRKTDPAAKSLSAQAFGIAPKMKEVDDWLRAHPNAQSWLWEIHPELSFRTIAGHRVLDDKKTAHGQADRLRLVDAEFPDVLDVISATRLRASEAQLTDVLDGYAALESALRVAAGDYEELGGQTDRVGLVMRMVF
jgi:predicted RNase H-like nuclease